MNLTHDFTKCPRCSAPTIQSTAWDGSTSEFWYECTRCNTYINTYIPQLHQRAVHEDSHKFVGNFGGYGTGKTTTTREEIYKHLFITPKASCLVGANTAPQYEQTIKKELEADIPRAFVSKYSVQKSTMTLINGARILYRPLEAFNKLRSYNLSMFVIVEGSECPTEAYTQLKTRLRNLSAVVYERDEFDNIIYRKSRSGTLVPKIKIDWLKGIVESNPDSGWVKRLLLMVSENVYKYGTVEDEYYIDKVDIDHYTSSHIASSDVNEYLPDGWKDSVTANKPAWWVKKFVYGSFNYSEGSVYPSAMTNIVPEFEIPKTWKRLCAFDYGLSDNSAYVFGAIEPIKGIIYIYKEIVVNDMNIEMLARYFHQEANKIPTGLWYCQPIIDPKSAPKRDYDKKSLADHFIDYGIYFKPGFINVDARVFKTNTYFEAGKLKIFDCCRTLINELKEYKFATRTLDAKKNPDKPEDKNNHCINPLEWICMELPKDPKDLEFASFNSLGVNLEEEDKPDEEWMPYALTDDDNEEDSSWMF